jgi:hypothetical protein
LDKAVRKQTKEYCTNDLLWSFTVILLPDIFTMLNSNRSKMAGHVAEIEME